MKHELPSEHSLSEKIISNLVFTEGEAFSLTDAQYASLEAGLGKGESLLVLSPTSTGKTQIAVWAIANGIETNANTVYLVTHRALAKQKFHDFQELLLEQYLDNNPSSIVLATGDEVVDCNGENPSDPLTAPLLVATYEKYLAMLSSSGVPSSMANTVVVCDEIQLLGDKSRGQNVEVLLTLMKNAGWKQFVGLSAVLEDKDGVELANWLQVTLVRLTNREKNLRYEYWGKEGIESVCTSSPDEASNEKLPPLKGHQINNIVDYLGAQKPPPFPVIVFCMRKPDVYELAQKDLEIREQKNGPQLPLDFGDLPSTSANSFLAKALAHRIAIHSADLTDDERKIVEERLIENRIDVVYATSTLAAGVNFPLGAAIFHKWVRWDNDVKMHVPIDASEFHNMAGRVGRMGVDHDEGQVLFFPEHRSHPEAYKSYLQLNNLPPIRCRIDEKAFDKLSLQLVATGLCGNRDEVITLICSSFSGLREEDNNLNSFNEWPDKVNKAIDYLIENGMIVEMSDMRLLSTPVGKAVAHSGFRPASAVILLNYFSLKGSILADLLKSPIDDSRVNRFAYLIFSAAFSTPEFNTYGGIRASRFLPWPLRDPLFDANIYAEDLLEPLWYADPIAINSAQMALDWINGTKLGDQEKVHSNLKAGMLLDMYRNLGWCMQGISSILSAASDSRTPDPMRPASLKDNSELLHALRKLPRAITRLSFRVSSGLPDNALWMNGLNQPGEPYRLNREEILALRDNDLINPENMMLGTPEADAKRISVFVNTKPTPQAKANWLRERCRSWKSSQRLGACDRHKERAKNCPEVQLIPDFYTCRGLKFEEAFENIMEHTGINFQKLDDGTQTGAPDYLIELNNSPELIMELKSREGTNLISYNGATEVLSAAEIHGYRDSFCVTLCHPGVDPSIPMNITGSGRLSVVESHDLGEALLRLCQGRITQEQLWQWLATPGQALSADLPYKEH